MTTYHSYDQIPAEVRRYILDETGERRVKRVNLDLCSELATDYYQYATEEESLKKFQLHFQRRDGVVNVKSYDNYKSAALALDKELNYNINSNRDLTAVITQNGRPVRGYENGQVLFSRSIYG